MKKKKSGAEITKIIIKGILISGGIAIAATNPYFGVRILPKILKYAQYKLKHRKQKASFQSTFSRLKNKGLIQMEYRGRQIYISLTEEGREFAGKYDIDDLEIKKPKKWDKKWRILIFDVDERQRIKREALRGKIKELGLYQLQKSVWVCPYEFQKEIEILRTFFGFKHDEMRVIVASKIENDRVVRGFFSLNTK